MEPNQMESRPKKINPIKNLEILSARLAEGLFAGNYRSAFRGPGLEFDEVREYVSGDDSRTIDWNVTSRMGTPFSKQFCEEREMNFFFIIDISPSVDVGIGRVPRREMLGTVAALLAYSASYNNDRVGAVFFSDKIEKWIPPMKGRRQVARILNDMMTLKPSGKGSDLAAAAGTVYQTLKHSGICVVVSDFKMAKGQYELSLLARKNDVIAIRISDPIDEHLPISGLIEVEDPETGDSAYSMMNSRAFQKKYRDFWSRHFYAWEKECDRAGVGFFEISTNADPVAEIMNFFKRRRGIK